METRYRKDTPGQGVVSIWRYVSSGTSRGGWLGLDLGEKAGASDQLWRLEQMPGCWSGGYSKSSFLLFCFY